MNEYDVQIKGMHCKSCEVLIEKEVKNIQQVTKLSINHKTSILHITTDSNISKQNVIKKINNLITKYGYSASIANSDKRGSKMETIFAFLISISVFLLFFLIQKSDFISNLNLTDNPLITSLLIGIIASISSCMAMVGSLVISLTTLNNNLIALVKFHLTRLISFFVLGGMLGFLGGVISINENLKITLNIIVYISMIIVGLNMLKIIPPRFIPNISLPKLPLIQKALNSSSPILLGFITFFLPCGFTQSMQIFAINQGSIISSSLTMLLFAIGTLPVLLLLSLGIYTLKKSLNFSFLLKISGFLIILFTLYNLVLLLISLGIISYG